MKTYNIIEVLNMPVGTEFTIENGIESYVFVVKKGKYSAIGLCSKRFGGFGDFVALTKDNVNLKFVKVKKPLTFLEAMKLVNEGKKVTNNQIVGNAYYFKDESGKLRYCRHKHTSPANIFDEEINAEWYEYED